MATQSIPTDCLFTHIYDSDLIKSHLPHAQSLIGHDAYFYDYNNKEFRDYFVNYAFDREFITGGGYDEFHALTHQQRSLVAYDIIQASKENKMPILCYSNSTAYTEDKFKKINLENYKNAKTNHLMKQENVLQCLYRSIEGYGMFDLFKLNPINLFECQISSMRELKYIIKYLDTEDLVFSPHLREKKEISSNLNEVQLLPTPKGYGFLNTKNSFNSKKVFIAMQFDWSKDTANTDITDELRIKYIETIIEACKECDYEASPVTSNHTNFITDQIIKEIRESKFMITDFTFNNRGAYFEAGFARALGKDVIHTVHTRHKEGDANFQKLHFDIKQINYIEWSDLELLKKDLINRIKSLGY